MAVGTFMQQFFIAAPRDQVFQTFILPHNQLQWHPMMKEVHDFVERTDSEGRTIYEYWYDEDVKMFGLTFGNKVRGRYTIFEPNEHLLMEGWSVLNIFVQTTIKMRDEGDGTIIDEKCTINMPFFVKNFTLKTAQAAHKEMFEALKRQMEQATRPT